MGATLEHIVRRAMSVAAISASSICAVDPIEAQSNSNLKYFGFTGACDDEQSIAETRPFMNTCTVEITDPRLSDPRWVGMMMANEMKVILIAHTTFFEPGVASDGSNRHRLRPDYLNRWLNAVLPIRSAIGGLVEWVYLADEPNWNGIPLSEIRIVHNAVKSTFPLIPTLVSLNSQITAQWFANQQIPTDAVGYHQYAILDPQTNAEYQSRMQLIKLHAVDKEVVYVMDAWWTDSRHGDASISPSQMAQVARNYEQVAKNDPDAVGLVGFHWPTFGEGVGARDLPLNVKLEYRRIGAEITAKCKAPDFINYPENAIFSQDCRFFATVQYWIPHDNNATGFATVVPQSEEFANFYFFSESNIEGGLKVIDARQMFHQWWFFHTLNTTLPTKLTVYDTQQNNRPIIMSTIPAGSPTGRFFAIVDWE